MAIARLGSIIGGISGTLGGTTYANTKTGLVLKQRLRRADHATEAQLSTRAIRDYYRKFWQTLTDTERNAWNKAAESYITTNRLGKPIHLSGFQCWQHRCAILSAAMPTWGRKPPLMYAPKPITSFNIQANPGPVLILSAYDPTPTAHYHCQVWGCQPWSNKARKASAYWRKINAWGNFYDPDDQSAKWWGKFGDLAVDQVIGIRLRVFCYDCAFGFATITKWHTVTAP